MGFSPHRTAQSLSGRWLRSPRALWGKGRWAHESFVTTPCGPYQGMLAWSPNSSKGSTGERNQAGLVGQGQELGRGGTPLVALALQELCVMRNLHLAL